MEGVIPFLYRAIASYTDGARSRSAWLVTHIYPPTPADSCHRISCSHLRRLPQRSLHRHQSIRTVETHLLMLLYLKIAEEIEADVREFLDVCGRKEVMAVVIIDPSVRNL